MALPSLTATMRPVTAKSLLQQRPLPLPQSTNTHSRGSRRPSRRVASFGAVLCHNNSATRSISQPPPNNSCNTTTSSTKPRTTMLVDYSKRKANLPPRAQSERQLIFPRRAKSLDHHHHDGSCWSAKHDRPAPRAGQRPPPSTRRAYTSRSSSPTATTGSASTNNSNNSMTQKRRPLVLTKAKSAREIVDWSKLESSLDWQFDNTATPTSGTSGTATSSSPATTNRSQRRSHSNCTELLRSSFMTKPLGMSMSHLSTSNINTNSTLVKGGGAGGLLGDHVMEDVSEITQFSLSLSPQSSPSIKRRTTTTTTDKKRGDLDSSMHFEDVFDGKKQDDTVKEDKDKDQDETSLLLKKLSKESKTAPPLHGRFYQPMSAVSSMTGSPPPRRDNPLLKERSNTTEPPPMDDASFTFRRSASIRRPPKKGNNTSESSLGDLPSWDGDFDSSFSKLEQHDDESAARGTTTGDCTTPAEKHAPSSLSPPKKNKSSILLVDDDEASLYPEDDELLFLPKGLTKGLTTPATAVKPFTAGVTLSNVRDTTPMYQDCSEVTEETTTPSLDQDLSEFTEETFAVDDDVREALRKPDVISFDTAPTPNNVLDAPVQERDPKVVMNFAVRRISSENRLVDNRSRSFDSATCAFSDQDAAMGDETLKQRERDLVIQSNPSFRHGVKAQRKLGNEEKQGQKQRPNFEPAAVDRRRGGLSKQLSVTRLGCEYDRYSQETQTTVAMKANALKAMTGTKGADSSRSDSPVITIQNRRQYLSKCKSASQLMPKRGNLATHSLMAWEVERNPCGGTGTRQDRYRKLSTSPTTPQSTGSPVHGKRRQPVTRMRSFDDATSAGAKSSRGGFRDASSFLTGSRIRRIKGGGAGASDSTNSSTFHNSLNLSGVFNYHSASDNSGANDKKTNNRHNNSTGCLFE